MDGFLAVLSPSAATGPALQSMALLLAFAAVVFPACHRGVAAPRFHRGLTCYTLPPCPLPIRWNRPRGKPAHTGLPRNLTTLLHGAGYLTTVGVAAAGLLEIPFGPRFAVVAALFAAFAGALTVIFATERCHGKGRFVGVTLAASAIAISLMAIGSAPIYGGILLIVLCTIVGMRLSIGVAVAWVVAATVSLLVCLLVRGETEWLSTVLSFGAGFFAFFAFAVALRRALQARAKVSSSWRSSPARRAGSATWPSWKSASASPGRCMTRSGTGSPRRPCSWREPVGSSPPSRRAPFVWWKHPASRCGRGWMSCARQ